eukprot:4128644-Amphidinium_carterae.1
MLALLRWFIVFGLPALVHAEPSSGELALMQTVVAHSRSTSNQTSASLQRQTNSVIDKIVFVRLHKVGSSTLSSILRRYCDVREKNCFVGPPAMTATASNLESIIADFQSRMLPPLDIFQNHVVMNTILLNALIPGNFKIALFRTPLSRTMSAFRHVSGSKWVNSMMASLMNNLYTNCSGAPLGSFDDAMMLMSDQVSPEQVDDLDFVMLTEEYDLSLMMLRRKLGWSMVDMLYRRQRDNHEAELVSASEAFEEYLSQPLHALNEATQLYLQNCIGGDESR